MLRNGAAALLLGASLRPVSGQTGAARAAAGKSARSVLLQLRPRVGDTIVMRLDQQAEVVRKREPARAANPDSSWMIGTTVTFSRAVIESAIAASTTILAITDSVLTSSSDKHGQSTALTTQKQVAGQRVRFAVAPDGSIAMPGSADTPPQGMSRTSSLIPATFPTNAVAVGDTWMREADLPSGTSQLGTGIVGRVKASFRLDSIAADGDLAYVSMHGELLPEKKGAMMEGVATVDDGTVDGFMIVDRDRGWLLESRFNILAHSTLRQPFGISGAPMSFEIHLTQHLRTVGSRH
jgi:hypothetical protein